MGSGTQIISKTRSIN